MNIGRQRAYEVLIKNKGLIKGKGQGLQTIGRDKNTYSDGSNTKKKNLIMVPGYLCNQGTYVHLLDKINKDNDFNLIRLEDSPERWKSIVDFSSTNEGAINILKTMDRIGIESATLLGHSMGGNKIVAATAIAKEKGISSKIDEVVTLSSSLSGVEAISELPIVKRFYKSIQDMHPESDVIKAIRENGRVDHRFVTTKDEIFSPEEMGFDKGEEHILNHGHFDYSHGQENVMEDTAGQIRRVLLAA